MAIPREITDEMLNDFRTRIHPSNAACLSATEIRTGLAAVFAAHVWAVLPTTIDEDGWERETLPADDGLTDHCGCHGYRRGVGACPAEPRTLREILFTHRALAGASSIDITELMNELQPLIR